MAETDLHIYKNITKTLHYNVNGIPKDVVYWVAKLKNWEKNIKLSEEHTEYKWLSLADAKVYSTYEDFNNMLDEFDSKIKEEMQ